MATFYGSDTTCVSGLPLIDLQITDPAILIGQRLDRRLQTPRGALALIGDDANGGLDLRQYINGKVGPNQLAAMESDIKAECEKDEEVQSVGVSVSFAAGVLSVFIVGIASSGPFSLTLNVTDLTVDAVFNP